ncbi:MAG: CtkA family protein, partial [Eubacteriales bacterium]|nr:CtkA family protein [Eubacteriales bacterium]
MIDFTNCKVDPYKAYSGANGQKICVWYDDARYMLKFPPLATRNKAMSYSNGCLSEYLACHIFASMGFNTQETLLGTYTMND